MVRLLLHNHFPASVPINVAKDSLHTFDIYRWFELHDGFDFCRIWFSALLKDNMA